MKIEIWQFVVLWGFALIGATMVLLSLIFNLKCWWLRRYRESDTQTNPTRFQEIIRWPAYWWRTRKPTPKKEEK